MALIDIKVPYIGDFKDVAVIEILVKPRDTVKAEQSLITVESDKASMEIPSSHAGVVKEVKVKLGDTVNEGTVILSLEAEGANSSVRAEPVEAPGATGTGTSAGSARADGAGASTGSARTDVVAPAAAS